MKQYRLVKNFCGKGKGEIFEIPDDHDMITWMHEGAEIHLPTQSLLLIELPKLTFIPDGFEITSFRSVTGNTKGLVFNDCNKSITNLYGYLEEVKNGTCEIYSITRKSDNQEFKIGDKVCWNWSMNSVPYFTIESFNVDHNMLYFNNTWTFQSMNPADNFRKYKEVLFKTDEPLIYLNTSTGYDVHQGDTVFGFFKKNYKNLIEIQCDSSVSRNNFFLFKTKMAANDWLKLQKSIKRTGMQIGQLIPSSNYVMKVFKSYRTSEMPKPDFKHIIYLNKGGSARINKFCVHEGLPCIYSTVKNYIVIISMDSIKSVEENKLTFGGKEVEIKYNSEYVNNLDIKIHGIKTSYWELKQFQASVLSITKFKLGGKLGSNYFVEDNREIKIVFGAYIEGTLSELEAILNEADNIFLTTKQIS